MVEPPRDDPFFIGWLPVPRANRVYQLGIAIFAVQIALATALLFAGRQSSPGAGVWDDTPQTVEGVVYASPYPMIRVRGELVRTILLVTTGKLGAAARVQPFDGRSVRVTGTMLHRDGRHMMELADGDDGVQPTSMSEAEFRTLCRGEPIDLGEVTLVGEIVDSKCYLGGMKPGAGKTHKGCAVLCLRGGVPPMLVTRGSYYLVIGPDGGPAGEAILPFVGDPIRVTGRAQRLNDLLILRLDPRIDCLR
jgi:hypothetical protein